uniref:Uncharacterized protein n=1 Tax=Romanomermis culicivorax TaxID=13658 RepID=A0A915IXS0_ROMCU
VIAAGIIERTERLELRSDQKFSGPYWVIQLKNLFFNKMELTNCEGILIETKTTEESLFSDTILMPAYCFASEEYTKPEHFYITGVEQSAVAFVEYDFNGDQTGRTIDYNIDSITIHLKYSLTDNDYNLAIIKLKTPAHPFRGLPFSSFAPNEVANCSVAGLMTKFNFPITSRFQMYNEDYPIFMDTIVNLPELKTADGNRTIVSEVPLLPNNTIFWDRTIYFHNIAAFYGWIMNPAKPSSIHEKLFHDQLAEFESSFRHDASLKNGTVVKNWYYAKEWQINSMAD